VAVAMTVSCASAPPDGDLGPGEEAPRYSLVFMVHGDGEYTFHDTLGVAHEADEEILAQARTVAERNPNAEVFLFHETHRKRLLFLIPRKDGHAYYYRNGRLMAERAYWRDDGEGRFDPALDIYDELTATRTETPVRMFLYFGHEVPEFVGSGYDASYPERRFTVYDLARGLDHMGSPPARVDLLVLGTCFGGTPYTINTLAPYARFIVASPENVHRSYFDLGALENLQTGPYTSDTRAFAIDFARRAFETLAAGVQTAVSVAVYEADSVQTFVGEVEGSYQRSVSTLKTNARIPSARCDCADDSTYVLPQIDQGVTVFYRPARFGRWTTKSSHSGWTCWQARDVVATRP
jgi:hypothetical protein